MAFVEISPAEIKSEITIEPVDSFRLDNPFDDVTLVEVAEASAADVSISSTDDDDGGGGDGKRLPTDEEIFESFCDRIKEAVDEGEMHQSFEEEPQIVVTLNTEDEEVPPEEETGIQDSGGVFKDHSYSLFKDVSSVNELLRTYTMSTQTDAVPLSGTTQNIFQILELLATIASVPSHSEDADLSTILDRIDVHAAKIRDQCNAKRRRQLQEVYSQNEYLKDVSEMGTVIAKQCKSVAQGMNGKSMERQEELIRQFRVTIDERLSEFRKEHSVVSTSEVEVQTYSQVSVSAVACQTEEKEVVESTCQTDPLAEKTKQKLFTPSDLEDSSSGGGGSASSGAQRKKRRKRKKDIVTAMLQGDSGAEEQVQESRRKERRTLPATGSDDEIDRLLNFNNLDRDYEEREEGGDAGENGASKPQRTEANEKKKKVPGETVEDILNDIDIDQESDGEVAAKEKKTDEKTEEKMFLKELNLEHKNLLLCSSSSDDDDSRSDSGFETLLQAKRVTVQDSDQDSDVEDKVDLFLADFSAKEPNKKEKKRKVTEVQKGVGEKKGNDCTGETAEDPPELTKQRRDSFDREMADLLKDTDSEGEEKVDKNGTEDHSKSKKKQKPQEDDDDDQSPLDLSDTVGKRSRKESLDQSSDGESMMEKRKRVLMSSQSVEKQDAIVLKAHQNKNPLLCPRPDPTPSPAVSTATSRDPDCISLSSSSSIEELTEIGKEKKEPACATTVSQQTPWKQRNTRKMMDEDELDINTKKAQRDEQERLKRLERKQETLKKFLADPSSGQLYKNDFVLDVDPKTKKVVRVHPDILKYLKEHQLEGVKFMYDCTYGSVVDMDKGHPGSGCILAHCMGLGKTLQQITVMHTVVQYPELKTNRILVICPKSTVMNWFEECQRWIGAIVDGVRLKVFYMPDQSDMTTRIKILHRWHNCGKPGFPAAGVLLLGHEAFRVMVLKQRHESINSQIHEFLLDPGPDLVICDEGHVIKNPKSAISQAVSKIKTKRRIVLTGTPIQNNLKEYFCMVSFIKPLFLGTLKEFSNLYANPIKSGQHKDSTQREIKIMQQRSYVLHKKLEKFVQRREAATLKQFLPDKYEYVIFVPLTAVQERLYRFFLGQNKNDGDWSGRSLIADYTFLRKIWTHPKVLESAYKNAIEEQNKQRAKEQRERLAQNNEQEEEDVPDDVLDKRSDALSVTNDWWRSYLSQMDLESLLPSHKLRIMFEILKLARENGEKVLIFSAFVAVLNVVEYFMAKIDQKDVNASAYGLDNFQGPWQSGVNYYRLDGKTSKHARHTMIRRFNDPENTQVRAFLISAKAGGMGINLTAANRVIILDTSWNPSNDQQNIFRVFRLGQKRNCYVYRLLAMGTMEEKVYSRSVTKQALSYRVMDEHQIDRHYNMAELDELYVLSMPDFGRRPVPIRPKDRMLAHLVHSLRTVIFKYHVHDSLLENKPEEHLSEAEKKEAWAEYEQQERRNEAPPPLLTTTAINTFDLTASSFAAQLASYASGMPGPSTVASPYLGPPMMNQYSADQYLQMVLAAGSYNPLLGNRYFSSGSLFPSDVGGVHQSHPPPHPPLPPSSLASVIGQMLPGIQAVASSSGADSSGGKSKGKRTKGAANQSHQNLAALKGFDPSFLYGSAATSLSPVSQRPAILQSQSLTRPGVVRIPSPPPFGTLPPTITIPPQRKRTANAASRGVPPVKTPVTLPPSTTIERLPLNTPVVQPTKQPILPSVPASISVEKVIPSPQPSHKNTTHASKVITAVPAKKAAQTKNPQQPMAVIDLIDDVVEANPGLRVRPIRLEDPMAKQKQPLSIDVTHHKPKTGQGPNKNPSLNPMTSPTFVNVAEQMTTSTSSPSSSSVTKTHTQAVPRRGPVNTQDPLAMSPNNVKAADKKRPPGTPVYKGPPTAAAQIPVPIQAKRNIPAPQQIRVGEPGGSSKEPPPLQKSSSVSTISSPRSGLVQRVKTTAALEAKRQSSSPSPATEGTSARTTAVRPSVLKRVVVPPPPLQFVSQTVTAAASPPKTPITIRNSSPARPNVKTMTVQPKRNTSLNPHSSPVTVPILGMATPTKEPLKTTTTVHKASALTPLSTGVSSPQMVRKNNTPIQSSLAKGNVVVSPATKAVAVKKDSSAPVTTAIPPRPKVIYVANGGNTTLGSPSPSAQKPPVTPVPKPIAMRTAVKRPAPGPPPTLPSPLKKVQLTAIGGSPSSSAAVIVPSNVPTNSTSLTVIQKNLQKRQNQKQTSP